VRRLAIGLFLAAAGSFAYGGLGSAQTDDPAPPVHVLQVSGLFDEIVVDSITDAIDRAERDGAQALILQTNSRGAVVGDEAMEELLERIDSAPIPVAVWVGPSSARLYGTPAQLLTVADVSGMAPGARVGYTGLPLETGGEPVDFGAAAGALRAGSVGLSDARSLGVFDQGRVTDEGVATLKNMVDALDGYTEGGVTLRTTEQTVNEDGTVQREPIATVVMSKLSLTDQIFHSVASPSIALLLFLTGMSLLVFEFFTAGVGIAGVVGAGSLLLACTGLAALPARGWAVAVLVAAMVAFAIDVQVGIPRFWTGVGVVFTIIGSWWLFESLPGATLRPSWITLIAAVGGVTVAFTAGMPSMVRTRFATPTIGREWMMGELGEVVVAVDPEGVVAVGAGQWRARTNRATPVPAGQQVRVVGIDGVTLEVEPLEGAAKDYRERRRQDEPR
jgi:membrane-bound serine protease (ClpP class)